MSAYSGYEMTQQRRREIMEDNALAEVQDLDRAIVKDLYVFRMAMARLQMPGARRTALNAATRILDYLEARS